MGTMTIDTPWGRADRVEKVGRGILAVSTPSHGGYFVPQELYDAMPEALRVNPYGRGTWFEEDYEWSLVALAFPDLFEAGQLGYAVKFVKAYKEPGSTYHAAYVWLTTTDAGAAIRDRATMPKD
jgi:hypothetical protein